MIQFSNSLTLFSHTKKDNGGKLIFWPRRLIHFLVQMFSGFASRERLCLTRSETVCPEWQHLPNIVKKRERKRERKIMIWFSNFQIIFSPTLFFSLREYIYTRLSYKWICLNEVTHLVIFKLIVSIFQSPLPKAPGPRKHALGER